MRVYENGDHKKDIVAMVARIKHGRYVVPEALAGSIERGNDVLPADPMESYVVRMHDQCHTSELFGSVKCDCQHQLAYSLQLLSDLAVAAWRRRADALLAATPPSGSPGLPGSPAAAAPATLPALHARTGAVSPAWAAVPTSTIVGALLYLPQEGRGIGLGAKVAAYALQEDSRGVVPGFAVLGDDGELLATRAGSCSVDGLDTVDANRALGLPDDARDYAGAVDVLSDLGLMAGPVARLLTNNPRKVDCLRALGVRVSGTVPCIVHLASPLAAAYVRAKAERMGHAIPPAAQAAMPASPARAATPRLPAGLAVAPGAPGGALASSPLAAALIAVPAAV